MSKLLNHIKKYGALELDWENRLFVQDGSIVHQMEQGNGVWEDVTHYDIGWNLLEGAAAKTLLASICGHPKLYHFDPVIGELGCSGYLYIGSCDGIVSLKYETEWIDLLIQIWDRLEQSETQTHKERQEYIHEL